MMKNKQTPKFFTITALLIALLIIGITPVYASDDGIDAIAITVIIPPLSERPTTATTASTPRVFPINVAEGYNYEGVRELIRIYELLPGESPEWINTASFTRNGYYYQIAEIVRRVDVAHTVREHTEVVKIPTSTNDLAGVIAGLEPTMNFADEYGYVGVLHLDIRSIQMTQDGTRSTSRTVSQTREFPHLSNPDLALIPQTINAGGRTYTLADINWRTNTSVPIDFNSVAQTFTAFATYTRTATSSVSTGYTTRAEYSGTLTRVSTGDVRFVATFIGTPIVGTVTNRPVSCPEIEVVPCDDEANGEKVYLENPCDEVAVYEPSNGNGYVNNGDTDESTISEAETVQETYGNEQNGGIPLWLLLLLLPLAAVIAALVLMMLRFKRKADALEQKARDDAASALSSRMTNIVNQDRAELAEAYSDDYEFGDSDENNFDEEGEDDV